MFTLTKESGPKSERRVGSMTLAGILVSFLLAAPGQAQAKPFCPCWEDQAGQPGLTAKIDTFLGGDPGQAFNCTVDNKLGARTFSFQVDAEQFRANTVRTQKKCRLFDPDRLELDISGGQIAKCLRDIKAACAQFGQ